MQCTTSKLGKFWRLPIVDKMLFLRAVYWLGVARARLAITPFRRLAMSLSADAGDTAIEPDPRYLERVGFAVRAAAKNVPWRADCFPQALAARSILKHRGYAISIHLGVEKAGGGDIAGHAWLTCGELVVTGGENLDRYTEMHRINA